MVSALRIAVIGVGPRGLSVLERVISHAKQPGPPIELLLIEPGELGLGIHRLKQPDYLLLNTIAGQLTIFSDEQMTPGMPITAGPSFYQWCQQRRTGVRFDEFLPRRLLGEYLQWAVGEFMRRVPARLTVRHLPVVAHAIRPDGATAVVTLADGTEHRVDLAVVTTGHGLANAGPTGPGSADDFAQSESGNLIDTPYPLPEQVERIPGGTTVALLGTGLTSMDVIATLTVGRGGEFAGGRYRPSGEEPRIVLVNRSGWLPCARPSTTEDRRASPARFLTRTAIDELRDHTADGRLDFKRQIEPLIRQEALGRMDLATPEQLQMVLQVLEPANETAADYGRYVDRLVSLALADLREAELGLGVSPVKEGLEVLRDHREALRAAIDPPGLTEDSHRYFMTEYVQMVNRAVICPQKERIQELLMLIDAGIVSLARPGAEADPGRGGLDPDFDPADASAPDRGGGGDPRQPDQTDRLRRIRPDGGLAADLGRAGEQRQPAAGPGRVRRAAKRRRRWCRGRYREQVRRDLRAAGRGR